MTESQFTQKLLRALKQHPALREAWIQKHNDRTSAGIPDFSVTRNRVTVWYEVKMWPNRPTKLQAWTLRRLKDGGALIIVKGRDCVITPITQIGYLTFEQLVEEIVQRSMF